MSAISSFLGKLSDTEKAWTALAGAFSIGVVATVALITFTGIPERVDALEVTVSDRVIIHDSLASAIAANTAAVAETKAEARRQYTSLVCFLTDGADMTPIQAKQECER